MTLFKAEIPELKKYIKESERLQQDATGAKESGLKSAGYAGTKTVSDYIATEAYNTWPKNHPLTKTFTEPRVSNKWKLRKGKHTAFRFLKNYTRYIQKKSKVSIGFGKDKKRFDRKIENIARRVETGEKINVTNKMRRFFGATANFSKKKNRKIGNNFFPLSNRIKTIIVPKRKITPVEKIVVKNSFPVFKNRYIKAFSRRSFFADNEFRKGVSQEKTL